MRQFFSIVLFALVATTLSAQQGNRFDFQIQPSVEGTHHEMQLQLHDPEAVQFIRVTFMQGDNELEIYEASLNRKSNGKYFLFFQNEEFAVRPDLIPLQFPKSEGVVGQTTVLVRLLDYNFNVLDSLAHNID